MSFSKQETSVKPIVSIKDARIAPKWGPGSSDVLWGVPLNHPRKDLNNEIIHSSSIVHRDKDVIETRNTIYVVKNWVK